MGDWFASIISGIVDSISFWFLSIIYSIFSAILTACDVIKTCFNKFAGIENFENSNNDIISQALDSSVIKNLMISLIVLCVILMIVLTIITIIKNMYATNKIGWKAILLNNLKGFVGFFVIPAVCMFGMLIGNIVLKAIDGATNLSGYYSVSSMLFNTTSDKSDYISVLMDSDDIDDQNSAFKLAEYYVSDEVGDLSKAIEYYYNFNCNESIYEKSLLNLSAEEIKSASSESGSLVETTDYKKVSELYPNVTSYEDLLTIVWNVQDLDNYDYSLDYDLSHKIYTLKNGVYEQVSVNEIMNFKLSKNISNYYILLEDTYVDDLAKFGLISKISYSIRTGFTDNFLSFFKNNPNASFTISTDKIYEITDIYSKSYTVKFDSTDNAGNIINNYHLTTKNVVCFYSLSDMNLFMAIIGSLFMGYAFIVLIIGLIKRMFNIVFLYVLSPIPLSMIPFSGQSAFNNWKTDFIKNVIAGYSAVAGLNIYFSVYDVFNNITYFGVAFWDGVIKFLVFVVGLMCVNEIIDRISSYIGGGNLFSEGKSTYGTFKTGMSKATNIVTSPIRTIASIGARTKAGYDATFSGLKAEEETLTGKKYKDFSAGEKATIVGKSLLKGGTELVKGVGFEASKAVGADIEGSIKSIKDTAINKYREVEKETLLPINDRLRDLGTYTLSGRNGYKEFLQNQKKNWGSYYRNVTLTKDVLGNPVQPEFTEEGNKYVEFKVPFNVADRQNIINILNKTFELENSVTDNANTSVGSENQSLAESQVERLKKELQQLILGVIHPVRKNNILTAYRNNIGNNNLTVNDIINVENVARQELEQIVVDEENARNEFHNIVSNGFENMVNNKAFIEYLKLIHRDNKYH